MDYNPYLASYTELKLNVSITENAKNRRTEQIEWYDNFDGSNAFSELHSVTREINSLRKELDEVDIKIAPRNELVEDLKVATRLGFDPRYWFSDERSKKKLELNGHQQALAELIQQRDELQQRAQLKTAEFNNQQSELERYRCFNPLEAKAEVKGLSIQIEQLMSELEQLQPLKERLDDQLREPLAELTKFEIRKECLEREIDEAKLLEQQLSSAANSYERRKIHESCELKFSESRPAKVIRAKQPELESIKRNIDKLKDRLQSISERATRIVKTLVIDGNNMCYQHDTFIGLAALHVVADMLSIDHEVIIVFDSGIRGLLQMNNQNIVQRFGNAVKIHVVASKKGADETLLDASADSHSYVISNDRFVDYPDKAVVRENRIFRHEILNGKVLIHDLNLNENFDTKT